MREFGCKTFVFSSSASVYGNPHIVPIREDFPLLTSNPYGQSKLIIEKLLQDIIPKFDIIIPLAGLVGAPACDKNRKLAISLNYKSIKSLIKYSSLEQKIIFPTTNSGYGIGIDEEYCTEKSHLNPISLYGKTKVDAEKIILDAGNALSLRLATVLV